VSIITLTKHAQNIVGSDAPSCGDAGAPKIELVVVTPAMLEAGLERARELIGEAPDYVVTAVYLAMEYERLFMNGQLSSLNKQALKVRQA
jgi:hypothetical protein